MDIIALSAKDGLYHSTARDGYNFMNSCSAEIFVHIFTAHCPYQTLAKLRKPWVVVLDLPWMISSLNLSLLFDFLSCWFLIRRFHSSCRPWSGFDEHDDSFRARVQAYGRSFFPAVYPFFPSSLSWGHYQHKQLIEGRTQTFFYQYLTSVVSKGFPNWRWSDFKGRVSLNFFILS